MSDRREFLKLTATAAATGLAPGAALAGPVPGVRPRRPLQEAQETLPPLGNGEPPAFVFQAYPGGTGALLERLWSETDGPSFAPSTLDVAPWEGPVPTREEDLAFLPVHRLAALIRERHVSPTELTRIYLDRLRRYDPELLFAVTILEGRAREEAQQAEADLAAGGWKGPLHGIPYGLKDLFSVRGAPTTWGSADFRDRIVDEDAEVVLRLRDAGAILLAKLSTGEFARGDRWYRGRTLNPWNPEQGSSGSSAGPASATAAACVGFGVGTETQGSITSPARRCGLSALRPTFGRVSRHGGMVLAWSMDKVGPLCRTVEDCALVFHAIHGSDEKDPSTLTAPFSFRRDPDLSAYRIGYTDDAPDPFLARLRELGADLRPLPGLPDGRSNALSVESAAAFDFHVAPKLRRETADAAAAPDEERDERGERFTRGRDVSALEYLQSQRRRHLLMVETARAMEGFDMFVSGSGEVRLTNQTGHPAVVVPYDFRSDEDRPAQPVCTTIVGGLFRDDAILEVAHAYQVSTDWHTRRPTLDRPSSGAYRQTPPAARGGDSAEAGPVAGPVLLGDRRDAAVKSDAKSDTAS